MISDIRLQHFRSYDDAFFELDPSVNIIAGPNASGKTNLLEAVMMIAQGASYRAKDNELLEFRQEWARLDANTPGGQRTVKLQDKPPGIQKTYVIDSQNLSRLHITKTLPMVLFEPDHLLLLSSSPDLRRTFLDDLIAQTVPGFDATRKHYRRVLSQRNTLLKKNPRDLHEQLFVWNVRLSELGGQIAKQRTALIARFNERATELYRSIAGRSNEVQLQYASKLPQEAYETTLLHKLESNTELDILRGYTVYGPHRDDLLVLIDGRPAQETASRGETRTLVLALKIMELQLLEETRGSRPLLLLDDVFSELDERRRSHLTQLVGIYQTFITTTDADIIAGHFVSSNIIRLGN
jgi:DNA replication and repair protein RecF